MKTGIKSPGRREMAKRLKGRFSADELYKMRGEIPAAVEQDRAFYLAFQQWKKSGCQDERYAAEMRQRWQEVMGNG